MAGAQQHGSRIAARVEGRSSLARIGLMLHLTAPTIHAGFEGNITIEMLSHSPFRGRTRPLRGGPLPLRRARPDG